jgi:prepilin signal peptidase PulO-like enzyme (type II secretory pathway)
VEEKEGVLTKTVSLRPNLDDRKAEIEKLAKVKKPEDLVWVTPGLPFLVFILLGFVFGLLATDVFAVLFKLFTILV